MFRYLKNKKRNKELEEILRRLQMNVSNNYKDAAQQNLAEFADRLRQLEVSGDVDGALRAQYEEILRQYREQMANFTHKDQKPYWT